MYSNIFVINVGDVYNILHWENSINFKIFIGEKIP